MRRISAILLIITLSASVYAQDKNGGKWSGDFSVIAGSNFKPRFMDITYGEDTPDMKQWTNTTVSGTAKLGYKNKKFFIEATGNLNYNNNIGNDCVVTGNIVDLPSLSAELVDKDNDKTNTGGGLQFGWNIKTNDELKFRYNYTYSFVNGHNIKYAAYAEEDKYKDKYSTAVEDVNNMTRTHNSGATYKHVIEKDKRDFVADFQMLMKSVDNYSYWECVNASALGIYEQVYRITPYSYTNEFNLSGKYTDKSIFHVAGFEGNVTLGIAYKDNKDYQRAATYYDPRWYDSLKYSSDFRFEEIIVSPRFQAIYKKNIHELNVSITPQFYIRKLSSRDMVGDFNNGNISNLIDLTYKIAPWKYNRFEVTFNRSVARPSYLQTCWFRRTGSTDNHLIYEGDPSLMPSATYRGKIGYTYERNGLSITPSVGYTYGFRIIEQTFYTEDKYKIFTWINSGENHTTDVSLKIVYKYKGLKFEGGGSLKYFHGIRNKGSNSYSSDCSFYANASYENRGWKSILKSYYQSAITRTYTSMTEIIGLDLHVEKKLGKFTLFAEGNNLLDRNVDVTILSADELQCREESHVYNKRVFLLGAKFKF